jgi:hypothetical protein
MRQLGADLFVLEGDDLGKRGVAQALHGARLPVLFESTGDCCEVAQLVIWVEDGGSVIAFAAVTGQAAGRDRSVRKSGILFNTPNCVDVFVVVGCRRSADAL